MKNYLAIFLILACLAEGGSVALPDGMMLEWKFADSDSVDLTFTVPQETYDQFGYFTIGFQYGDIADYIGSDLLYLIKGVEPKDSYMNEYERPNSDVSMGGTNDIAASFKQKEEDNSQVIRWSRPPDTGDQFDVQLVQNDEYYVVWSHGFTDEYGKPIMPTDEQKGMELVTLSASFTNQATTNFLEFSGL